MKNILIFLLLISSAGFSQAINPLVFIPGQGWVTKKLLDSPAIATALAGVSQGSVADGSITNIKLAGSIAASKLIGSDIVLPESQITNLVTDLASKPGISAAATPTTTGTMTVTMTSGTQNIFTITPTGACTFNASGGKIGAMMTFAVTTSGTSAFVLTFGTNFHKTATLSTGTTSARFFTVTFICVDGTTWWELCRTAVQT